MKNEKLEKSVTVPAPKSRSMEGPLVAAIVALTVSLTVNLILFTEYERAEESKASFSSGYFALQDMNASLQRKLDGMKDDIKELTNDEAETALAARHTVDRDEHGSDSTVRAEGGFEVVLGGLKRQAADEDLVAGHTCVDTSL